MLQICAFTSAPKLDKMPTNAKGTKGLGKALFEAVGFLTFLLGSLILLTTVIGAIGSIFTSTKPLFQFKRVKKDEDNSHEQDVQSQPQPSRGDGD
jgi:hypothetical protein